MKSTLQQKFVGASKLLVAATAVAVLALGAVGARADGGVFHKIYTGWFGDTLAPAPRDIVLSSDTGSVFMSTGLMVPQEDGSFQISGTATISDGNQQALVVWTGSLTANADDTSVQFSASFAPYVDQNGNPVDQNGNPVASGLFGSFSGTIDPANGAMILGVDGFAV